MTRAQDDLIDVSDVRRRSVRKSRHAARASLHQACWDDEILDEAVLPDAPHDVGRKASPKPRKPLAPGRRRGFKVWKTHYWKRRRHLWAEQNAAARRLAQEE
jgi:hypothetical protein